MNMLLCIDLVAYCTCWHISDNQNCYFSLIVMFLPNSERKEGSSKNTRAIFCFRTHCTWCLCLVCVCVCVVQCDSLLVIVGGVRPLLISRVALLVTSQEPRGSKTQSPRNSSGTTFCRIHSTTWLLTSKAMVFSIWSTPAVSFIV